MLKIKVFYHLYIPDDLRACSWTWCVDQQLQMIKKSKLYNIAEVYMCVTMPCGWIDLFGSPIIWNNSNQTTTFAFKLQEYIWNRYPWVNILNIRDTADPNLFEGVTLQKMHEQSLDQDFFALYIHAKGVIPQSSPSVASWREILNYYLIDNWVENIKFLNDYQVVAINDAHTEHAAVVSGNFFWARSDYLRELCNPLDQHLYVDVEPMAPLNRYSLEAWILHKNPQVKYLINTHVNHYGSYCFLENILENPTNYQ